MINSKDLHTIISSLSKSEKRYFKDKSLKLNPKGAKYVILFDILDSLKEFSAKEYQTQLALKGIQKNVSFTQNYLFNTLLEELNNFRKQYSIEQNIKNSISQAKFLYERNLLDLYSKVLKNAEKQASKYEFFDTLMEIKIDQKNLLKQTYSKKGISKAIEKLNAEIENLTEKKAFFNKIKSYLSQLYNIGADGFDLRDNQKKKEVEIIKQYLHSISISEKDGFRIQFYYYVIKETIATHLNEDALIYGSAIMKLYKKHKHFLELDLGGYIKSLLNFSQSLLENNQFDDYIIVKKELEKIKQHCQSKGLLFLCDMIDEGILVSDYYLFYYQNIFEETEAHLIRLNNLLDKEHTSQYKKLMYLHSVPYFYFNNRAFEKAFEWNVKLQNIPITQGVNLDYYSKYKILEIILHYELGNFLVLDCLIDTNEKYLKKHKRYFETERILFKLFRNKHFIEGNKMKLKPQFENTLHSLKELFNHNNDEASEAKSIDYIGWLNNRVQEK